MQLQSWGRPLKLVGVMVYSDIEGFDRFMMQFGRFVEFSTISKGFNYNVKLKCGNRNRLRRQNSTSNGFLLYDFSLEPQSRVSLRTGRLREQLSSNWTENSFELVCSFKGELPESDMDSQPQIKQHTSYEYLEFSEIWKLN